jgi:hypothetical protein
MRNLSKLTLLTLVRHSMKRPIPSEIGILATLTYLNLLLPDVTGSIPSEIGNLSKLGNIACQLACVLSPVFICADLNFSYPCSDTLLIISERKIGNILLP